MKHFQLQRLHHIFPLAEPQNQFVTFLHTAGSEPHPVVKISKLISPFFPVIPLFQLFQNPYALLQLHVLGLVELILQNISARIPGRHLRKFLIKLQGLHIVARFNTQLTERIADCPSPLPPVIGKQEHIFGILIPPVDLVQIADGAEHHDAFHPPPVNGVRDLSRLGEILFLYQRLYFFRFYFIFILIQGNSLPTLVPAMGSIPSVRYPISFLV